MPEHPALSQSRQLLLVISPGWDSTSATLYRYERVQAGRTWQRLETMPVSLGKSGFAWGIGLHGAAASDGPAKREGDGKSPAGIFALGPAFGYAPKADAGVHGMPYLQLTDQTFGIEDPASQYYNTIVDARTIPAPDWKGADHMLRADDLYLHGVMVQHNPHPGPQNPPLGSCIFLHVWRGAGQPTAGCTAMAPEKIAALSAWLRDDAQPRLVQLTAADYGRLRSEWGLPKTGPSFSVAFGLLLLVALAAGLAAGIYLRRRART